MTKRSFSIFTFFFIAFLALGQVHPTVKQIFYDLPLEKSRAELREVMARDKRFTSTDTLSELYKDSIPYFRGVTTDKGIITSKPDLVEIQLTFGNSSNTNGQADILNLKYFYSNKKSAETEYQNLIKLLGAVFKDPTDVKVETPYSKGTTRYEYTAAGKLFENPDPYYRVEVLKAKMANKTFGLFVEFRRKGK